MMTKLNLLFGFPPLLALAASPIYSMRCLETTVRTYVRCQQECINFTPADFLKLQTLITTCTSRVRFGCQLSGCGLMGFECLHDPAHPFDICANGVTKFEETTVDDVQPAIFSVDVNAPPLKIQYYFLVDTSGSMAPHLNMVKQKVRELVNMYKTMEGVDAKFSLGSYRDPSYSGSPRSLSNGLCGLNRISGFTSNVDMFIGDVNGLSTASDTHTGPQALLPALAQIAEFESGWDAEARKILVVIGDAPGYERTKHDLPRIRNPLDRDTVAGFLLEKDISLIGMNIGTPGFDGPTINYKSNDVARSTGQVSFIAERTGGVVTTPSKTLMEAVIEAKEKFVHVYTMDASDCEEHDVVVKVNGEDSAFRVSLKPSESSTVEMSLSVKSGACFNPFECRIRFQEDGIDLMPLTMDFLKLLGCRPASELI